MALRSINSQSNFAIWRQQYNLLAADVGDISTLTTDITTSVVAALNDIQDQIDNVSAGALALPNDTYLEAGSATIGSVNLIKASTNDKIVFGVEVEDITIEGGEITALDTPLPIAAGGTGGADAAAARTALGLAIGTDVQAYSVNLTNLAAAAVAANSFIAGNSGGTAWEVLTPTEARTRLGLAIGTNVQAWDANLDQIATLTPTLNTMMVGNGTAWYNTDAAGVRTALNMVIGTHIQAYNQYLQQIAAITPSTNSILVGLASGGPGWEALTGATARSRLGLAIGTDIQAYSASLNTISGLAATENNFLIGGAGNVWTSATPAASRIALGLRLPADGSPTVLGYSTAGASITGLTPAGANVFAVSSGASTWALQDVAGVRSILSLIPGTHVQAYNSKLQDLSGYTPTTDNFLIGNGSTYILATQASARQKLGVRTAALDGAGNADVQAYSAKLTTIAALPGTANSVIIGTGSSWTAQSGSSLRSSIGAAGSGANSDITSLTGCADIRPSAGNLSLRGNGMGTGVLIYGAATNLIVTFTSAGQIIPTFRPNYGLFSHTTTRSLDPSVGGSAYEIAVGNIINTMISDLIDLGIWQ